MKFSVVLATVATLCAVNAVPVIPGDNSHYVEGESRFIWMPDGEGVPHLVDLHAPVDEDFLNERNGANNQYWLLTRFPSSNDAWKNDWVQIIRESRKESGLIPSGSSVICSIHFEECEEWLPSSVRWRYFPSQANVPYLSFARTSSGH